MEAAAAEIPPPPSGLKKLSGRICKRKTKKESILKATGAQVKGRLKPTGVMCPHFLAEGQVKQQWFEPTVAQQTHGGGSIFDRAGSGSKRLSRAKQDRKVCMTFFKSVAKVEEQALIQRVFKWGSRSGQREPHVYGLRRWKTQR